MQDYTDKRISPDGQFLKIDSGSYTIIPLNKDETLLRLKTNYIAKTHVNIYAKLWGEIFLGDIHNNVLAIIKHRAEASTDICCEADNSVFLEEANKSAELLRR